MEIAHVASGQTPAAEIGNSALEQHAYIWQRVWTASLKKNLREHASAFSQLDVLAAEISWVPSPAVSKVHADWETLRSTGRKIGIVVRIGPRAGAWARDASETGLVVETCRDVLERARLAGIEPAELQIDFDAATSGLRSFADLLHLLRSAPGAPSLVITSLPDWLRSPSFGRVLEEVDCFVLQVHSIEKPARRGDAVTLFSSAMAAAWIKGAGEMNRSFRIALPTYGYRTIFDVAGRFSGLESEGPPLSWPEGYTSRVVDADPATLAPFVRELSARAPKGCIGVEWFRFPNGPDALAWSWPTLEAVMLGQIPEPRIELITRPTPAGSVDLFEANQGNGTGKPRTFVMKFQGARLLGADGLGGWQVVPLGPDAFAVRPPSDGAFGSLRPGESVQVGWVRLDKPAPLSLSRDNSDSP